MNFYTEYLPVTLADLKHSIPFPDSLHAYHQALSGYHELARNYGCFAVEGQFMGVNESGVVKVWSGKQWGEWHVLPGIISQSTMVQNIIDAIEESVDPRRSHP